MREGARCPLCSTELTGAEFTQGRAAEDGAMRPPAITFQPCGHRVEGPAAAHHRNRILGQ